MLPNEVVLMAFKTYQKVSVLHYKVLINSY